MKKFVLLAMACMPLLALAQQPNIQSPDVASINKFIDHPVDKSTGLPTINVPLYTLKLRDFSLPISLSYHSSGIKVEELSSNVGLGWALNTAGIISRTVKGMPDEYGYYAFNGPPEIPIIFEEIDGGTGNFWYWNELSGYDTEPDIFSFSVNGHSGKFVIDKDHKIHMIPQQNLKMEMTDGFGSWKLTTPDGTQYFAGPYDYVSVSSPEPLCWHIGKIVTPNLDTVELEYQAEGSHLQKVLNHESGVAYLNHCPETHEITIYQDMISHTIKKIKSTLCNIEFYYKTTRREDYSNTSPATNSKYALDNIRVIDNLNNSTIRKLILSTSYFTSSSYEGWYPTLVSDYHRKRLRLDEVKECDSADNCLPGYKFSYNKYNKTYNNTLPNRMTRGQDLWGYYNGSDFNSGFFPTLRDPSNDTLLCQTIIDRMPNEDYAKAYILDEIINPNGGVTAYQYECIRQTPTSPLLGGLRVREINHNPNNNEVAIIKRYEYSNAVIVGGTPKFTQHITDNAYGNESNYEIQSPCGYNANTAFVVRYPAMAFAYPAITTGDLTSQYIFHESVKETQARKGSIESVFDVADLYAEQADWENDTYPVVNGMPIILGNKLIKETYRDSADNIVKEVEYSYAKYTALAISAIDAYKIYRPFCKQRFKNFGITTGCSYLTEKKEYTYKTYPTDYLLQTTAFEYDGIPLVMDQGTPLHHFPSREIITTSEGYINTKRMLYPLDYKSSLSGSVSGDTWDDPANGIRHLINRWIVETPVETIVTRTKSGVETITGATLNIYKNQVSGYKNLVALNKVKKLHFATSPSYTSGLRSSITKVSNSYQFNYNSSYRDEGEFIRYDTSGNLLEMIGKDELRNAFIWGYKNSSPVAKVLNAEYKDVFYTSFENESGATLGGKTGKFSKTGGFSKSLTDLTNGNYILSYWQKSGGLWSLQSTNATVSGNNYTISLSGQVDEVRFYPASAVMSTYTYDPLIGITSETDINNRNTFYEYDVMGRLKRIRDHDNYISKQVDYEYQQAIYPTAAWKNTGNARCKRCEIDTNYYSSMRQVQLVDTNVSSPTYNKTTWVDSAATSACIYEADWQNTSSTRCGKDAYNKNTGNIERQQINWNPCSPHYKKTRWVHETRDTSVCHLPVIYAKLTYQNHEYYEYQNTTVAEIYVHFYSDSACTQPYSVSDLTVYFRSVNGCTSTVNSSKVISGYFDIIFDEYGPTNYLSYDPDEYTTCIVNYYLNTGAGYVIVNW